MATGKRFYWIKLREDFVESPAIDYLFGLPGGYKYVLLYVILCLKTINTEGRFEQQIGDMLIPYDIEKIRRDTKWFSADTIRVALTLYKQSGLIYEEVNGVLVIADYQNLVGSETDSARRMQKMRNRRKCEQLQSHCDAEGDESVTPENRDKSIETRDKSIETRDQISENLLNNNDNNNPADDAERAVDEFSVRSGVDLGAYLSITPKLREQVKRVTKRIFQKACTAEPTEIDESKVYAYAYDPDEKRISNERIYILTCAFYKASERGQTGNWYYIESILADMHSKGISTKDEAVDYFYARKGED